MVSMVVIALTAAALGGIAWAVDKNRSTFGALLPGGAAVVTALVLWTILMALGLDNDPATAWMPWIFSIVAGGVAAWAVAGLVGRTRHAHLVQRTNQILQMH